MAKSSGIGEVIGWGIAGVGVWWVGSMFGWWSDIFGAATVPPASTPTTGTAPTTTTAPVTTSTPSAPTTTTTTPTTPSAPPKVPVTTPHNLPPRVVLAGPVTAGVHAGSLKASVTIGSTTQTLACSTTLGCYDAAGHGVTLPSGVTVAQIYALMQAAAPKGLSGYGMSAGIIPAGVPMRVPGARVMVHARRKNYVMRGAGY
jgi:hypothetical protein